MNGKQKKMLLRIILSSLIYMVLLILKNIGVLDILSVWIEFILFLIPYLLVGYDIILKAFRNICHGQVFDENFLMMLGYFGALWVHEFRKLLQSRAFLPDRRTLCIVAAWQIKKINIGYDEYLS